MNGPSHRRDRVVQAGRDQLLAGAALADDQRRALERGHLRGLLQQGHEGGDCPISGGKSLSFISGRCLANNTMLWHIGTCMVRRKWPDMADFRHFRNWHSGCKEGTIKTRPRSCPDGCLFPLERHRQFQPQCAARPRRGSPEDRPPDHPGDGGHAGRDPAPPRRARSPTARSCRAGSRSSMPRRPTGSARPSLGRVAPAATTSAKAALTARAQASEAVGLLAPGDRRDRRPPGQDRCRPRQAAGQADRSEEQAEGLRDPPRHGARPDPHPHPAA